MNIIGLELRVLGPLAVFRDGEEIRVVGTRQRMVLALLLLDAGRAVSAERLLDQVWGLTGPSSGTGPLRTTIWQLRRLLDAEDAADPTPSESPTTGSRRRLLSRPSLTAGYLLDVLPGQIDSHRFEQSFGAARAAAAAGQPHRGLALLDEALGLWRGPAFGDLAEEPTIQPEAERLDQLRVGAEELRAELRLATGRHHEVAAELETLVRDHPQRESLWALLMTALYRAGRQGDALRCFARARTWLVENLGIEPGPELRRLEAAILAQDPTLDRQPPLQTEAEADPGTGAEAEAEGDAARGDPDAAVNGEPGSAWAVRGTPATPGGPEGPGATPSAGVPHNLPRQLTSFIGRQAELTMVTDSLRGSRLVTLAGPGGSGKTRLGLAVAEAVLAEYPDGAWFVDLAAVTDASLVDRAVAEPFGVETDQPDQLDHVCRRIGDSLMLLMLDNCEHLVEAVAATVEVLLRRCPSLRILATSREELRLGAEAVWRVPELSLPIAGDLRHDQALLASSEAVQLFVDRGRSALAGFAPTGEALRSVAQICQRLDGIPLAIELAAALVGSLPVADIATRLDDRFQLLEQGRRQGAERHRTLRATLDWSFELLDEDARQLFIRLGVFVGDFTLAAAETVAAVGEGSDPLVVARGLRRLVTTSMVGCVTSSEGAYRYRLLETIRQYAREQLDRLEVADHIYRRHARYYADFAAEAERHVHGAAASEWLARVVSELPNLRAAATWTISHDDVETGLRLAGSLQWFVARMALLDEAARWLDAGLQGRTAGGGEDLPPDLRLMALTAASTVAYMRGDFSRTRQLGEESIALARQLEDTHQLAIALIVRGAAVVYEGDLSRAEECFTEAETLCAQLGDRWGMAWLLTSWAVASRRAGRMERARRQLEESLATFRSLQDQHGQVLPLVNLALGAQEEGQLDDALRLAEEAAATAIQLQDRQLQHVSLCVVGRVELSLGHVGRARELLVRCIRDFPGAHNRMMLAIALDGLAGLTVAAERHSDGVALLGFARGLRERQRISVSEPRGRELDNWLDMARSTIGDDQVALDLARGRALGLDEAVSLAEAATAGFAADSHLAGLIGGRSRR